MTSAVATAQVPTVGAPRAGFLRLFRAELRWIFHRPRTLIVLGLIGIIPAIVGTAIAFAGAPKGPGGATNPGAGMLGAAVSNPLVLPIATLTILLAFLLPLIAAMAAADALAGESSHGTLRGWLLAPVSRGRLLVVKALGVAVVVVAAVALVCVVGVLTGLVMNGFDGLTTLSGTTVGIPETIGRVAVAAGWVTGQLFAVGAVALAISSATEHPMLVVVGVLAGNIVFSVLSILDALSWLRPFLLNESWPIALAGVLRDPMMLETLGEGSLRALCYAVIGLSIAYARIKTKDG